MNSWSDTLKRMPLLRRNTAIAALLLAAATLQAAPPKGLMLNLDLQNIRNGLIPSRTLFPLYVPLNGLETGTSFERTVLLLREGQGLDIPHSALLDPDGSDWVAGIRIFAQSDGMVMSQSDGSRGYAIYIKDGAVQAAIQTGHSTLFLRERQENGVTECLGQWVTIELIIRNNVAILSLNRRHVALVPLQTPLQRTNCRIRIGTHETLPELLARSKAAEPGGFTGAVSSLKIFRQ